jgi:hypothetical protein
VLCTGVLSTKQSIQVINFYPVCMDFIECVNSVDPDQQAHPCHLIRSGSTLFPSRLEIT